MFTLNSVRTLYRISFLIESYASQNLYYNNNNNNNNKYHYMFPSRLVKFSWCHEFVHNVIW